MLVTLLGIVVFLHTNTNTFVLVSIIALQLSLLSYFGLPASTLIQVIASQPENESLAIFVTDFGMNTEVRLEQSMNALSPMLVTEFGIVTEVRPEQP